MLHGLAAPPRADGLCLAHANCPQTYSRYNYGHPSMLGMLPGQVDVATMRRTLHACHEQWRWHEAWGWDFPMAAMCAARLGEPALALDLLMMNGPKNRYLAHGHAWQSDDLPAYLPGNGGLLAAVAMLLAGWLSPGEPAGFPDGWRIRQTGLRPAL